VNICFTIPLHKPNQNEPSQHHSYVVQTPRLMQTVKIWLVFGSIGLNRGWLISYVDRSFYGLPCPEMNEMME
jgi:hypothetical protein